MTTEPIGREDAANDSYPDLDSEGREGFQIRWDNLLGDTVECDRCGCRDHDSDNGYDEVLG